MTDHAELRRLAEDVIRIERSEDEPISAAWDLFDSAANPKAILALLDEIDRLKAENDELRRLCSCAKQYDLSMTLRRMIDAVLEGDKP
ncbi:TPA: hypothetical protein ACGJ07_005421 [Pseudomonas aeruginosa]|uniref:hypothetical protein n=1 Tax=Pseudomonas aeruginosa TaxID=287 RepID=UPI00053D6475|nr:hypothetical protein [Pseudomonas aeruginosa]